MTGGLALAIMSRSFENDDCGDSISLTRASSLIVVLLCNCHDKKKLPKRKKKTLQQIHNVHPKLFSI